MYDNNDVGEFIVIYVLKLCWQNPCFIIVAFTNQQDEPKQATVYQCQFFASIMYKYKRIYNIPDANDII